jgi:hypothetical protein
MNRKKILIAIFIVTCIAVLYTFVLQYDLKHYGIVATGIVIDDAFPAKSARMEFKYKIFFKGKERVGFSDAGVYNPGEFYGKSFTVIVSTLTGRSVILITPDQFKKFNIPYPDSLKWVLNYVE